MLRAVGEEDRQARRISILEAARALYRQGDGRLPTSAEIAETAGLAKGTVYLYFKTKEEIFANVLLEGWLPLLASTETIFGEGGKEDRLRPVRAFIEATVRHLENEPELMRLDALGAGVLEKNMTQDSLLEYKRRFNQGLVDAGSSLERSLGLTTGRGVQLLMRTYPLIRGLWQTAEHSEVVVAVGIEAAAHPLQIPFSQELAEALEEYWRGALL